MLKKTKAIKRRIHQFFNGHLMLYSRHLFRKYMKRTKQGAQRHEIYLLVSNWYLMKEKSKLVRYWLQNKNINSVSQSIFVLFCSWYKIIPSRYFIFLSKENRMFLAIVLPFLVCFFPLFLLILEFNQQTKANVQWVQGNCCQLQGQVLF